MTSNAVLEVTSSRPRKINARFGERLPVIIEQISSTLIQVRPPLQEVTIAVQELHDFLNFEIQKIQLAMSRNAIAESTDPQRLLEDEAWLSRLEYLVSEFEPKHASSSIAFLTELKRELEEAFHGRGSRTKAEVAGSGD